MHSRPFVKRLVGLSDVDRGLAIRFSYFWTIPTNNRINRSTPPDFPLPQIISPLTRTWSRSISRVIWSMGIFFAFLRANALPFSRRWIARRSHASGICIGNISYMNDAYWTEFNADKMYCCASKMGAPHTRCSESTQSRCSRALYASNTIPPPSGNLKSNLLLPP